MLFLAVAASGIASDGFAALRYSPHQRSLLATAVPSPLRKQCNRTRGTAPFLRPEAACEYHDGRLAVAVLGDSHAGAFAPGLANELRERGLKVKQLSYGGCVPTFGRRETGNLAACSEWVEAATSYLAQRPDITTVVVAYRFQAHLFGEHLGRYPELPRSVPPKLRLQRWEATVGLLQYLVDHGKRVVLLLQVPELPRTIDWLIARAPEDRDTIPGASRQWWDARTAWVRDRLRDVPPEVRIVDPTRLLCNATECVGAIGTVAYYFDDDHLSVAGARLVAREVIPHIQ